MSSETTTTTTKRKLAFCFLIYETINHEDIWQHYFEKVDPTQYNIYIHYKTNKPLRYFEKYKLPPRLCVPTKYADISLVKAQNVLLAAALNQDADNKHFIFVSDSCIPLKPFQTVYASLQIHFSYFNIAPQAQCFIDARCQPALAFVDKSLVRKASQWCILNRKHAHLMVFKNEHLQWFAKVYAADEHCYITNIFKHQLTKEIIVTPNLAADATTFTNWRGTAYKYPSTYRLKNYDIISEDEMRYLLSRKCLFGRKFMVPCGPSLMKGYYLDAIV